MTMLAQQLMMLSKRLELDSTIPGDSGVEALVHELCHLAVLRGHPVVRAHPMRLHLVPILNRPGWRKFPTWDVNNRALHSRHPVKDEVYTIAATICVLRASGLLVDEYVVIHDSCSALWGGSTREQRIREVHRIIDDPDTYAAAAVCIGMIAKLHRSRSKILEIPGALPSVR
jgi:hypothetical protein